VKRVVVALVAVLLGLTGCGNASHPVASPAMIRKLYRCRPDHGRDQIRRHNSGISCVSASAIVTVLAGKVAGPQTITSSKGGDWTCRDYLPSEFPLLVRCHQGVRFFTVERRSGSSTARRTHKARKGKFTGEFVEEEQTRTVK
jgi:hypothetical protein